MKKVDFVLTVAYSEGGVDAPRLIESIFEVRFALLRLDVF